MCLSNNKAWLAAGKMNGADSNTSEHQLKSSTASVVFEISISSSYSGLPESFQNYEYHILVLEAKCQILCCKYRCRYIFGIAVDSLLQGTKIMRN